MVYNNNYHHSIGKKPVHTDYIALTEESETNLEAPKSKISGRLWITKYKNILAKVKSREIFLIDHVMKTNPWTYKIKDLKQ